MANTTTGDFTLYKAPKLGMMAMTPLVCTQTKALSYHAYMIYNKVSFKSANEACVFNFVFACKKRADEWDIMPHYSAAHVRIALKAPNPSDIYEFVLNSLNNIFMSQARVIWSPGGIPEAFESEIR